MCVFAIILIIVFKNPAMSIFLIYLYILKQSNKKEENIRYLFEKIKA